MRPALPVLALISLALAACGPAPGLRPAGGGWGEVPALTDGGYARQDPARFGLTGQESLAEAGEIILSALEIDETDGQQALKIYSGEIIGLPRGAVVLTQDGLADDSLRSQQHVIEFDVSEETQAARATGYGTRQRCWRAANPDAWTSTPCP